MASSRSISTEVCYGIAIRYFAVTGAKQHRRCIIPYVHLPRVTRVVGSAVLSAEAIETPSLGTPQGGEESGGILLVPTLWS